MKKYVVSWLAGSCLVVGFSGGILAREGDAAPAMANAGGVPDTAQVRQRMSTLAVPFEVNTGQQDERVAFTARTLEGTLFVTRAGVLVYGFPGLPLAGQDTREAIQKRSPGWVLTETLVDARPVVRGDAPSATRVSRFIGNDPSRWQASVPTFDRVALGEPWPGIEVVLAAHGNSMEKLFTVAPGADARRIAISLSGAERLELAANGALIAHTGNGPVSFTAPRAWQVIKGERKSVRVAYALAGDRYGFRLRDYDPAYPVVIDPLLQSTYLGGSGGDIANAIALDTSGNVFVAGVTTSANFPGTAGGAQTAFVGGAGAFDGDVFVAKLANDLTTLTQTTYLGGGGNDKADALALDAAGNVYVAGSTASSNFPGTIGGAQSTHGGGADAFVAKLNNGLTTLVQATHLGGNGSDGANAIALDAPGNVFVAGTTTGNFPHTTGGAQPTFGGSSSIFRGDAFVARLANDLKSLAQATYLGGSLDDNANGIAVHASGVFVVGWTYSTNFPGAAVGGAQPAYGGDMGGTGYGGDAFVAKLAFDLKSLTRATYLGGNLQDTANAIALDASGNVFVAGITNSTNFPGVTGPQTTMAGNNDAFVAKLNNGLTNTPSPGIKATYLGGNQAEAAYAIALDTSGNVFVTGSTASTNFPGTTGGAQATYGGNSSSTGFVGDVFVTRLDNNLNSFTQSTYLGGSMDERANGIAIYPNDNTVFVAGTTISTNFPGTAGGAQTAFVSGASPFEGDAFVSKLTRGLHGLPFTATNDGDPHITTTNGIHYNFQAAGEFTALRDIGGFQPARVSPGSPKVTGLEIQTRQSPTSTFGAFFDEYTGLTTCVSLNTALAARVGKHRVTYQPNFKNAADPGGLQLRVDGVLTPLTTAGLSLSGGGRVVQTAGALEIDFPDGTVLIAMPYFAAPQWFLNIRVYRTEATEGIMGSIPKDSWLPALPNGKSVGKMPPLNQLNQRYVTLNQTFANAWRVSDATSLFDYAPGTSTATFTFAKWPAEKGPCVVPNHPPPAKPIELARAREICRPITDKTRNADCVFDVAATGVPGFAKAYLLTQRIEAGATTITVNGNLAPIDAPMPKPAPFLTATVVRLAAGGGTPTGTVQFMLDGEKIGKPVRLDARGLARWTAASHKPGEHQLSARYLPDKGSVFLPSSSEDKVVVIRGAR